MKVLHILHELYPSGAEMMIKTAYPYWCGRTEGTVMATGNSIGPFADTLRETGYEVVHVPTVGEGKKAKLKHLWAFFKYMRKHHYDVVHIHRESLAFEYAVLCKLTGNKHICRTVHSTFAHTGKQRLMKAVTRNVMRRWMGVKFIAISDGVAANEKKVFGLSCNEVIYNWCSNSEFPFVPEIEKAIPKRERLGKIDKKLQLISSHVLTVVTVGTCADVKNHTLLLRAIAQMKHKEQMHYFHVGYAKDITEEEQRLAGVLGILKQVSFVGQTEPMPYLKMADVYLMTSKYEGLSIAALEAIFTGMPVLLADVRGLDEFKGKGLDNVDYFEATPEKLAHKLDEYVDRLCEHKLLPSEAQSRRAAELYDIGRQTEKYVAVYQSLAGQQ
jgi:glycosyltransferase involved in cell wall biosynthesis